MSDRALRDFERRAARLRGRDVQAERLARFARSRPLFLEDRARGVGGDHATFVDPILHRAVAQLPTGRIGSNWVSEFLATCEASLRLRLAVEALADDTDRLADLVRSPDLLRRELREEWKLRVVPSPGWGRQEPSMAFLEAIARLLDARELEDPDGRIRAALEERSGGVATASEAPVEASPVSRPTPEADAPVPRATRRVSAGPDPGDLRRRIQDLRASLSAARQYRSLDDLGPVLDGASSTSDLAEVRGLVRRIAARLRGLGQTQEELDGEISRLVDEGSRTARQRELAVVGAELEAYRGRVDPLLAQVEEAYDLLESQEEAARPPRVPRRVRIPRPRGSYRLSQATKDRYMQESFKGGLFLLVVGHFLMFLLYYGGVSAWQKMFPRDPLWWQDSERPTLTEDQRVWGKLYLEAGQNRKAVLDLLFDESQVLAGRVEAARALAPWVSLSDAHLQYLAAAIRLHIQQGANDQIWRRALAPPLGLEIVVTRDGDHIDVSIWRAP